MTSGEIVPMVVSRSHSYPATTLAGAILLSIPTAILFTSPLAELVQSPPQNMWVFLLLAMFFFPIFHLLVSKNIIPQSFFLSSTEVEEEVREGAINAFYSEQLYKTKDENGILLYISVYEKKVWILGDRGINSKIEQGEWDKIVSELTCDIKKGDHCLAVCQAVEAIGRILQEHFPIKEGDKNELHNIIIK